MTTQLRPCTTHAAPAPCPAPEWAEWFRFQASPAVADRAGGGGQ